MKTLFKNQMRTMLAIATVGTLFAVAYVTNPNFLKAPQAQSATTDNVSGWVWSENIGWVSFNNTSDGSSQGYGVNVSTANKATGGTGDFSGNAWSENIGWVSFDRSKTGNPPAAPFNGGSGPIAQIDWSTGKVTGWMRALASSDPQAGGWDGWVSLSGAGTGATYTFDSLVFSSLPSRCSCDTGSGYQCNPSGTAGATFVGSDVGAVCYDWWDNAGTSVSHRFTRTATAPSYGVQVTGNKFGGYAWGSDVVGWVDFAPKIGNVSVGPVIGVPPCTVTDPAVSWGACQPLTSCSGSGSQSVSGIQVGACSSGGGTVTRSCTVTIACTPTGPGGAATTGCNRNGVCDAGENPVTCPSDCKVKYKQL